MRRQLVLLVGFAVVVALLAGSAAAGATRPAEPRVASASTAANTFPPGPPNDPGYAPAEQGGPTTCLTNATNDEEHQIYGSMPRCTPFAKDPEGASGMSIDKAWAHYTAGDAGTVVAYIEGGINWHDSSAAELANQVFINRGELPPPEDAAGHVHPSAPMDGYDLDRDGVFNVRDYALDPRVHDANGNHLLDPEDLIAAFSSWCNTGGRWHHDATGCADADNDHDGFPHDISGWDFYDHQNDPATVDATYGHANGQQQVIAAQGNDGQGGIGICPKCQILPIKAGAEALDRTDDLAQAWLYADQIGAKVVVSVTADLGYSSYMRQAVQKLWRDGVVMVEASNDFDSTDHQGGMFWPHVLPGNGLVTNTQNSVKNLPALNALTTTYRERSNYTSWGTHSMFSVATGGGTTSESTPTTGAVMALLSSFGAQEAHAGKLGSPLTGQEVIQLARATASRIDDPTLAWPGSPGDWNLQYGYGRPNAYKAMQAVAAGDIPPVAWIDSPDWYSLYDPTTTSAVPVSGHVEARRSPAYGWQLQWAVGAQPSDGDWKVANWGLGSAPTDGHLGDLDLSRVPASVWAAQQRLSTTKSMETNETYTVSVRVRVWDTSGRMGEERRSIAVQHDPTGRARFPFKDSASIESQPALVDLQGTGHLAAVFGDADGAVHAVDGMTGTDLPGFPVRTDPTLPQRAYQGIDPGHEPIVAPVAVGDLFHDGRQAIVATSTTGRTYAWDAQGRLLGGFPKTLDKSVVTPAVPRPALQYTRLPHLGATASPVLQDLDGDGTLEIVQAAWDGNVYVWHPDGTTVAGWPRRVALPTDFKTSLGRVLVRDAKLDVTPAIAYFEQGKPSIVVRSQYTEVMGSGIQPLGSNYVFAFRADGTPVTGWPVALPAVIAYYGSAQEFITEASNAPAVADVNGDGIDEVATGPIFSFTTLVGADGGLRAVYGPVGNPLAAVLSKLTDPAAVTALLQGKGVLPADLPVSFTSSGAFGRIGGRLTYSESGPGGASTALALLLPGSGTAIANFERAYDAATGLPIAGFPQAFQGLDFLGAPTIGDVTGDGQAEIVDGGDTSVLHAFTASGAQAPGFPKFTTGWVLFSPSLGDLGSTGRTSVVTGTREGYLMAWDTPGTCAGNGEWWSYHHDERRTGRYGTDTRPPGALRDVRYDAATGQVTFTAPGGDWYCGRADHYLVTVNGVPVGATDRPVAAGQTQTLTVPPHATVSIQAVDGAGNLGAPTIV